jgi:glycyl-tRNA synthetase beta chain
MVGEFPELQGLMGAHYARQSGESDQVALAIGEHYQPRFAGDTIPESDAGRIVSLADRIDTLVGIFAAGLKPTGNKDPFALRRSALGLLRILLEGRLDLSLDHLISTAANALSEHISVSDEAADEVRSFIIDRLRHHYTGQGFTTGLIQSALASDWRTLPDLDRRLRAISDFMGREEATSLAAANKRIGNILKKSKSSVSRKIETDRFVFEEEKRLFNEIADVESKVEPLFLSGQYEDYLSRLASLREPVDAYFDEVMVMDEDLDIRANRLALLARLKGLFDRVADLAVLG